ncbi:MAG: sulfatase [Myxococcales bacterium]|nr:sulfatase [Myxococcales bacterium]
MSDAAEPTGPLALVLRGALLGLGFGVAVATVHLTVGIVLILSLGMPAHTSFALQSVVMEIVLGGVVGAVLAPALLAAGRPERGAWVHAGLLAVAWIAFERWVAVDPSKLQMWVAPPLVGLAVFAVGRALSQRWPRTLAAATVALQVGLLLLPIARELSEEADEEVASGADAASQKPDVLFIVMDTVRAQSSSTYGYERETTPVLTELAEQGLKFADANTPATWSLPAHASLFTGTFPSVHNAHGETRRLDETLPTVAEVFRDAGYQTRCFSANPHISKSFGLIRGFDSCDEAWRLGSGARQFSFMYRFLDRLGLGSVDDKGGSTVVGNIRHWMEDRPDDDAPAFVFVNFLEAHFPFHQLPDDYLWAYHDRPISELRDAGQIAFGAQFGRQLTDAEVEQIRGPILDMYDGGVLYTDALVGQVIDEWRSRGLLDDTIVLVLADHGEVVGEHRCFGHVSAVVEEDLRVPMVFRYPPRIEAGSVVDHAVSTAGVFATLTDLAGLPTPESVQVSSLLAALPDTSGCEDLAPEEAGSCVAEAQATAEQVGKPIIAERFEEELLSARFAEGQANGEGPLVNPRGRYRTFRSPPYKLVQHSEGGPWLFHLELGEQRDLAPDQPDTVGQLEAELLQWAARLELPSLGAAVSAVAPAEMTDEERQALCDLGYLDC